MNDNLEMKKTDLNLYRKELNIFVDKKISFIQKLHFHSYQTTIYNTLYVSFQYEYA